MRYRKIRRVFLWRKIWQQLRKIHRENNVTGLFSFWCGECALLGRWFGKRYSISHYCWICGQDARKQNKWMKFIRPEAHELIAMSDFLVNEFYKNHSIKPQYVIPAAIDTMQFQSPLPSARDIDIMGAGSLIPLKQYDVFIVVVKSLQQKLPAIKAIQCGDGEEKAKLQSMVKTSELENNLSFLGEKPHKEILQLMQRTKVFLHTSNYEGFGVVCLEALYAGAHVISFCSPMEQQFPHWHIVHTAEEMMEKALELFQTPRTEYNPVLLYSMTDTAKSIMKLFGN
jgi:glycosyltransferase involved in cell wall biosynthesis